MVEYGIDATLVLRRLQMSPTERVRENARVANLLLASRGRAGHESSKDG